MSQQTNQNFLLKQQISQLKKQANKRYNSQQRPSQNQSSNAVVQQNSYGTNYGQKTKTNQISSQNVGNSQAANVYLQNQMIGTEALVKQNNFTDQKRAQSNIRIQSNNQMNMKPQNVNQQTPVMRNQSNNLIPTGNYKVMNSSDFAGHQLNPNNQEILAAAPNAMAMNQGNSHNRNSNNNQSNQRRKSKSTQPHSKMAASQRVQSEDLRVPNSGVNQNSSGVRNSEYLRNMAYGGKQGNDLTHAQKLASKSSGNLKQFKGNGQPQAPRNQGPAPVALNAQLQNSEKPPPRAQTNLGQHALDQQANNTHAQQFFSQRLSNSNTNLKHIIKVYKDDKGGGQSPPAQSKLLANNPAAAAVVMQANNRQPSANKNKGLPRAQSRESGAPFSRESAANFSDYRQVQVESGHGSQANLYPKSPPNIVGPPQAQHAPSNSYGNVSGVMGVKKRLDSSSRIAPDLINQNNYPKNIISPSHQRQNSQTPLPQTIGGKTNGTAYTTCQCPCPCNKQTNGSTHMASIFSNSQGPAPGQHALTHGKNNTIQLVRSNIGNGLSSLVHNTTIYGEENFVENGEIEELHYLMVRVEKMKKAMLGKVECSQLQTAPTIQNDKTKKDHILKTEAKQSNQKLSDEARREELLYRSTDYGEKQSTMVAGQQSVHLSIKGEEQNSMKIQNEDLNVLTSGKKQNNMEVIGTNLILIDYE